MEVIKHGNVGTPEDWKPVVTCEKFDKFDDEGCGAELQIDAGDLVLRYFRGTHFTHYYPAIKCPECDKYTKVKEVPNPIYRQLDTVEGRKAATFDGFDDSIY